MSIDMLDTKTGADIQVRSLSRGAFTEYFLTARGRGENARRRAAAAAGPLFEEAAAFLAERGILPFQEKVYGLARERRAVLRAREAAFRARGIDPSPEATFIEGRPADGAELAGLQIWGIVPEDPSVTVRPVEREGRIVGRSLEGKGFRMIHLPGVRGAREDGTLPPEVTPQGARMFANAAALLKGAGYTYRQVARTWIYLARILDWYGEFNRVRSAHHDLVGVGRDGVVFPASTGIQGRSAGEECFMDVLAVDESGGGVRVRPHMKSPRQDPAFDYGSAFSRSTSLEIAGRSTIFVSGTASIDGAGETLYVGNPEAQALETLLTIAALLEEQGAGLRDIALSTVFCKTIAVWEAFRGVKRLLGLPDFPAVCVLADVCRPELLIEIEAMAIQPVKNGNEG